MSKFWLSADETFFFVSSVQVYPSLTYCFLRTVLNVSSAVAIQCRGRDASQGADARRGAP